MPQLDASGKDVTDVLLMREFVEDGMTVCQASA